jgi:hypothetical protein
LVFRALQAQGRANQTVPLPNLAGSRQGDEALLASRLLPLPPPRRPRIDLAQCTGRLPARVGRVGLCDVRAAGRPGLHPGGPVAGGFPHRRPGRASVPTEPSMISTAAYHRSEASDARADLASRFGDWTARFSALANCLPASESSRHHAVWALMHEGSTPVAAAQDADVAEPDIRAAVSAVRELQRGSPFVRRLQDWPRATPATSRRSSTSAGRKSGPPRGRSGGTSRGWPLTPWSPSSTGTR